MTKTIKATLLTLALLGGMLGFLAAPADAATYNCAGKGTLYYTSQPGMGDDYHWVRNTSGVAASVKVQVWATTTSGMTWQSTSFNVANNGYKNILRRAWYIVVTINPNGTAPSVVCARENDT